MGRECSTNGTDGKSVQNFGWEDLGIDEKIILEWFGLVWLVGRLGSFRLG